MNIGFKTDYDKLASEMLEELLNLYKSHGNITVLAFYRTINKSKVYYDFQLPNQPKINGSYDKLEIIELIFDLENKYT